MRNSCSAPSCKSNYRPDERIPCFRMPKAPPELKQAWIRALHRVHIDELQDVLVCIEHFTADVEHLHKVPNGDGTYISKNPSSQS